MSYTRQLEEKQTVSYKGQVLSKIFTLKGNIKKEMVKARLTFIFIFPLTEWSLGAFVDDVATTLHHFPPSSVRLESGKSRVGFPLSPWGLFQTVYQ